MRTNNLLTPSKARYFHVTPNSYNHMRMEGNGVFQMDICLQLVGFNVCQQTDCGIFEEVEHVVEIFGAAIVGVGDGGRIVVAEEVSHQE